FGFAENTDDLFVGKTLLHGDVLMWLMKTLLTSGCTNQRGAGHNHQVWLVMFAVRGLCRNAANIPGYSVKYEKAANAAFFYL
ncbi:hypothetical protein ABKV47_03000, partial [Enterobacter hormaechei]|nr:hypothetical protein [Enterobacter hormaechei]